MAELIANKGKEVTILRSLVDPMRFPNAEIVDLYSDKFEIELGCRGMKQTLLDSSAQQETRDDSARVMGRFAQL